MTKEQPLKIVTGLMLLMLCVIVPFVPEAYASYAALFYPALFLTLLAAILCGWLHAFLIGALVPLLIMVLFRESELIPDVVTESIVLSLSGLTAAICYNIFKSALGSVLAGLLLGRIAMAVTNMILYYYMGLSYTIGEFFDDAVLSVWPCLIACVVGIPILVALFRKLGVMTVLRHERYER